MEKEPRAARRAGDFGGGGRFPGNRKLLEGEGSCLTDCVERLVTSALQCTSCRSSGGDPAELQGSSGPVVKSPKGRALEYLILITFGTKGCLSLKLRNLA